MNFKELLDRYNNGSASEEEKKLIEEELNKYEVLTEYLSEGYNIDFEKQDLSEKPNNETLSIKRSVNKKLRKVIVLSVSIVFLILFAINFIVSPIVSSLYYNPSQKTIAKNHHDLYFDLRVLTELNMPGYAISTAGAESLGFGEYNIYFERLDLFKRLNKDIEVKVKRYMRIGSLDDFFPVNSVKFLDIRQPDLNNNIIEMQNEEIINHIKKLNPVSFISSYVIFKEDITLKEFDELRKKYNDKINLKWAGVRTEDKGTPPNYLSGFNPSFNDGSVSGESADKNKYPYLQLVDYMRDKIDSGTFDGSMVEAYAKHFMSLLKYVNDREKAVKALDYNKPKVDYYKNALSYVENNGINIYGVLVYGEAKELLEFISNEKIKTVDINNVLPSKYIN
jgi:hypothetical protein